MEYAFWKTLGLVIGAEKMSTPIWSIWDFYVVLNVTGCYRYPDFLESIPEYNQNITTSFQILGGMICYRKQFVS